MSEIIKGDDDGNSVNIRPSFSESSVHPPPHTQAAHLVRKGFKDVVGHVKGVVTLDPDLAPHHRRPAGKLAAKQLGRLFQLDAKQVQAADRRDVLLPANATARVRRRNVVSQETEKIFPQQTKQRGGETPHTNASNATFMHARTARGEQQSQPRTCFGSPCQ